MIGGGGLQNKNNSFQILYIEKYSADLYRTDGSCPVKETCDFYRTNLYAIQMLKVMTSHQTYI